MPRTISYRFRPSHKAPRRKRPANVRLDLPVKHPCRLNTRQSLTDRFGLESTGNDLSNNEKTLPDITDGVSLDDAFPDVPSKQRQSTYADKQKALSANWDVASKDMHNVFLEEYSFADNAVCVDCQEPAEYLCSDCGPAVYYCFLHCKENHLNKDNLHRQRARVSLHKSPICGIPRWASSVISPLSDPRSLHRRPVLCLFLDRKQIIEVLFHDSERDSNTLLRLGLFPATPEYPTIAFSLEVMEMFKELLLEGQMSYDAFIRALSNIYAAKGDIEPLPMSTRWNFYESFQRYAAVKERLTIDSLVGSQIHCSACYKVRISYIFLIASISLAGRKTNCLSSLPDTRIRRTRPRCCGRQFPIEPIPP